jgi:hypothetical protein
LKTQGELRGKVQDNARGQEGTIRQGRKKKESEKQGVELKASNLLGE